MAPAARRSDLPRARRALCAASTSAILTSGLDRLTAGEDPAGVVAEMLARADEAYDLLEHGLGRYTPPR